MNAPARSGVAGTLILAVVATLVVAAVLARSRAQELPPQANPQEAAAAPLATGLLAASFAAAGLGGLLLAAGGRRVLAQATNTTLTTIALVSALHFAVSVATRVGGVILYVLAPPLAVFLLAPFDEGLPSLLVAVVVILVPRPGTAALSILTVTLLNVLATGTLGLTAAMFALVSVAAHEGLLALVGVTTSRRTAAPRDRAPLDVVLRTGLAVGAANAVTLRLQYAVYIDLYRTHLPPAYVAHVTLWAGFVAGAVGAALGAYGAYRLRRVLT